MNRFLKLFKNKIPIYQLFRFAEKSWPKFLVPRIEEKDKSWAAHERRPEVESVNEEIVREDVDGRGLEAVDGHSQVSEQAGSADEEGAGQDVGQNLRLVSGPESGSGRLLRFLIRRKDGRRLDLDSKEDQPDGNCHLNQNA